MTPWDLVRCWNCRKTIYAGAKACWHCSEPVPTKADPEAKGQDNMADMVKKGRHKLGRV